jgi:hypothetical protein
VPKQRPRRSTKSLPERSRKAAADIEMKDKHRAAATKDRQRQHEADRPDRGGPQGRKDKDFQRKF